MKNKLLLVYLVFAVISGAFFTKHHITYFMNTDGKFLNYGFPLTGILMAPDNTLEHLYIGNIILNILLSLPVFTGWLSKRYRKTFSILVASSIILLLFIPWRFRLFSVRGMLILYTLCYVYFIFELLEIFRKKYTEKQF